MLNVRQSNRSHEPSSPKQRNQVSQIFCTNDPHDSKKCSSIRLLGYIWMDSEWRRVVVSTLSFLIMGRLVVIPYIGFRDLVTRFKVLTSTHFNPSDLIVICNNQIEKWTDCSKYTSLLINNTREIYLICYLCNIALIASLYREFRLLISIQECVKLAPPLSENKILYIYIWQNVKRNRQIIILRKKSRIWKAQNSCFRIAQLTPSAEKHTPFIHR